MVKASVQASLSTMSRIYVGWLILCFGVEAFCSFNCSDGELLGFYPKNPFTFEGVPFQACCQLNRNATVVEAALTNTTLVFSCTDYNNASLTPPMSPITHTVNDQDAVDSVCVNLTVSAKPGLFCDCQVPSQPECKARQYVTVDVHPSSDLTFDCIVYGDSNLTCRVDMPSFSHSDRVKTSIKWRQAGQDNTQSKSKLCSLYDTCVIHNIIQMLAVNLFDLMVMYVYDACSGDHACVDEDKVTKESEWKPYNLATKVLLVPVVLNASGTSSTAISISCNLQFSMSEQNLSINYTSVGTRRRSVEIFVESMDTINSVSVSLPDLHSFTNYTICASAKQVESSLWSTPSCVTEATKQDVPAISPKTVPDAFFVLDASVIMYWQPLSDSDWNCPPNEGRKYVLQKYNDQSKDFIERPDLTTTNAQASVTMGESAEGQVEFRVFSKNNLGLARNGSTIIIPQKENILPGPTDIKVVYKVSQGTIIVTWQSDDVGDEYTVFWCLKALQQYSCSNSLEWKKLDRKGDNSLSITKTKTLEPTLAMYGVASSRTGKGGGMMRSGIHWQPCMQVEDRNVTSSHGNCQLNESSKSTNSELPGWLIAVIVTVVFVIIFGFAAAMRGICYCKRRKRKTEKLMHSLQPSSNSRLVINEGEENNKNEDNLYEIVGETTLGNLNLPGAVNDGGDDVGGDIGDGGGGDGVGGDIDDGGGGDIGDGVGGDVGDGGGGDIGDGVGGDIGDGGGDIDDGGGGDDHGMDSGPHSNHYSRMTKDDKNGTSGETDGGSDETYPKSGIKIDLTHCSDDDNDSDSGAIDDGGGGGGDHGMDSGPHSNHYSRITKDNKNGTSGETVGGSDETYPKSGIKINLTHCSDDDNDSDSGAIDDGGGGGDHGMDSGPLPNHYSRMTKDNKNGTSGETDGGTFDDGKDGLLFSKQRQVNDTNGTQLDQIGS